jgi:hypothetical protein
VTRARLRFPHGDPLEVDLDEVVAYGPEIRGFRAWLGAVFASREGRYLVRFDDDRVLGFTRDELKRVRVTGDGAELVLGAGEEAVGVRETDVRSFGPEPEGARAWLGRLAHGSGEGWIRLRDGTEMRFPIGGGPHVTFVG